MLAGNDEIALGAIAALESIGKRGKVLVIGADGSPDALMALKAGRLTATVDYMGYEMVQVHGVGRSPPQRGKTGGARSRRPVPSDR
jgi:ABC-type sugar transport system substrate-binding protein